VLARSLAIAEWLIAAGVKALVVACNTATSAAVAELRARYALPVVAIEPALKPAALQSQSGVVAVLATSRTIEGNKFSQLREQYGSEVQILAQACPGLVEQVEAGELNTPATAALLRAYVEPLLAQGADTLVLACTHYLWLGECLRQIVGDEITIIDPAPAVARELRRRLAEAHLLAATATAPVVRAFTTGAPQRFRDQLHALGETSVPVNGIALNPDVLSVESGNTLA
jgi:glutamate racemase